MKGLRLKKQQINGKRENFHSNSQIAQNAFQQLKRLRTAALVTRALHGLKMPRSLETELGNWFL
jgi:hypothetical protein